MSLCGSQKQHEQIIKRINKVEGQVRGIRKLIENDKPCFDVLKQVAAAGGALKSIAFILLENHLRGCVSESIKGKDQNDDLIDRTLDLFRKFTS